MKNKLLYERALITCVLMLIVSIILKLFGVPWFNLDTSIPILNHIDDIITNSIPLSFVYSFILVFINTLLVCMLTIKTASKKMIIFISLFSCIIIPIKTFIRIDILSFVLDTIGPLSICYLCDKTTSIKEYIIVFLLNVLYQSISLFIRDLGYKIAFYGPLSSLLFNVDYYIILVITYLYIKKGETSLCSIFHRCGSYLVSLLWRKPTQNSNQCSSKEM